MHSLFLLQWLFFCCPGAPAADLPLSNSRVNYIPRSRWAKGVPPVMGAHLMPSGAVAPVSTSKGGILNQNHSA